MTVAARLMEANPTIPCHHCQRPMRLFQTVDRGPLIGSSCVCAAGGFAPSTNQTGAEVTLHIVPLRIANPRFVFAASNFGFHKKGPGNRPRHQGLPRPCPQRGRTWTFDQAHWRSSKGFPREYVWEVLPGARRPLQNS
jgi:hypothetical protein